MSHKEKIREILNFTSETDSSCSRLERSIPDDAVALKVDNSIALEPTVVKSRKSEAIIRTYPDLIAIDPSLVQEESKKRRRTHKRL